MHRYMKYIIVLPAHQSIPVAILFHYIIAHNTLGYHEDNIISAGFCYIDDDGDVQVFGKSDTLKKESRDKEDPPIIQETIRPRKEYDEGHDAKNFNIFRDQYDSRL